MKELPLIKCYKYIPTDQDREKLNNAREVIGLLFTRLKSGEIDGKTREVIDTHFYDSMQLHFDEYFKNPIDADVLNKKFYVTLFEAAFLIGSRINKDDPECLLFHSAGLFSDAFLSREVDPRCPLTMLKYNAYKLPARVGICVSTETEDDKEPYRLGKIHCWRRLKTDHPYRLKIDQGI